MYESAVTIILLNKYDYYTIKKLVKLYLSGELEITSTTIENINVTPKENKAS